MAVGDNFDTTKRGKLNDHTGRKSGHGLTQQNYMAGQMYSPQGFLSDDNLNHPCNAGCGCAETAKFNPLTVGETGCLLPPELTIDLVQAGSRDKAREFIEGGTAAGYSVHRFHLKYHNKAWRGRKCCDIDTSHDTPLELCDPCEVTTHIDGTKSECSFFGKEGSGRQAPVGLPSKDPRFVTSRLEVGNRLGMCFDLAGDKYENSKNGKNGQMGQGECMDPAQGGMTDICLDDQGVDVTDQFSNEQACTASFPGKPRYTWTAGNSWILIGERGCYENGQVLPNKDPHCYYLDPSLGQAPGRWNVALPSGPFDGWFQTTGKYDNEASCENGDAIFDPVKGEIGRCHCVEGCENAKYPSINKAQDEERTDILPPTLLFPTKEECLEKKHVCADSSNNWNVTHYDNQDDCLTVEKCVDDFDIEQSGMTAAGEEVCVANGFTWDRQTRADHNWVDSDFLYGKREWFPAQCIAFDPANAAAGETSPDGWKLAKDCDRKRGSGYFPSDEARNVFRDVIFEEHECLSGGVCWDKQSGVNVSKAHGLVDKRDCLLEGDCTDSLYDDRKNECLSRGGGYTEKNEWKPHVWTTKWLNNMPDTDGCCSGASITEAKSGAHQPHVNAMVVGQDTCVNCYEEVILMDVSDMNTSLLPALASEGVGPDGLGPFGGAGRGSGELALIWRGCDFCKTCEEQGACYDSGGNNLGLTRSQCSSGTMTWVSSQGGEVKVMFLPMNQILNCTNPNLQHNDDSAYEWANPAGHRPLDKHACYDVSGGCGFFQTNMVGDCEIYLYEEGAAEAGVLPDSKTRSVYHSGEHRSIALNMQMQPYKLTESKQCKYKTYAQAKADQGAISACLGLNCEIKDLPFWFDHDIADSTSWCTNARFSWDQLKDSTGCLGNRVSGEDCCGNNLHPYCNFCGPCATSLEGIVEGILGNPSIVFQTQKPGSLDYWGKTGLVPECALSSHLSETCYGTNKMGTIEFASNTSPVIIKSTGHGLRNGDAVRVDGVRGNFAANILTKGQVEEIQWGQKKGSKCTEGCDKLVNPRDNCVTWPWATPPGQEEPLPLWIVDFIDDDHFALLDCNHKPSDGRVQFQFIKNEFCLNSDGEDVTSEYPTQEKCEGAGGLDWNVTLEESAGYGTTGTEADPLTSLSGSQGQVPVWEVCPHTGTWELYNNPAEIIGAGLSGGGEFILRGFGFFKQNDQIASVQDWYVDISPTEVCPTCCDHWMPGTLVATVTDPGTTILDYGCGVDCNGDEFPAVDAGYMGSAHCDPIGICLVDDPSGAGQQKNQAECETNVRDDGSIAAGVWIALNDQDTCEKARCWSNGSDEELGNPLPALGNEDDCENRDLWPGQCTDGSGSPVPSYTTIDSCREADFTWNGTTITHWRGAIWTEAGFVQFTGPDGLPGKKWGDGYCCDCDENCSTPDGASGLTCGCRKCSERLRFLDEPVCRSAKLDAHTDAQLGNCEDDTCCSCECCPGDSRKASIRKEDWTGAFGQIDYPSLRNWDAVNGGNCGVAGDPLCMGCLCCEASENPNGVCMASPMAAPGVDTSECPNYSEDKDDCNNFGGGDVCMWTPQAGSSGVKNFYDKCNGDSEACTGFFNNRPLKCEGPFICVNEIPGRHECGAKARSSAEYGCYGVKNEQSEGTACPTCESAIVTGCDHFQRKEQEEACPGLETIDIPLEWDGYKWISDWEPMQPVSQAEGINPGADNCYVPPFVGGRQCKHHKKPDWILSKEDKDRGFDGWSPPFCIGAECNFCGDCETQRHEHNIPPGPTPCPTSKTSVYYMQLELGCGNALEPGGHGYPTIDSYSEHGLNLKANITTCRYNSQKNPPCPNPLDCGNDFPQLGPVKPARSIEGWNCGAFPPCTECCDFERPGLCHDVQGNLLDGTNDREDLSGEAGGENGINCTNAGFTWTPPPEDGCGSCLVFGANPAACLDLQGQVPTSCHEKAFRKKPEVFEVVDVQYGVGPSYTDSDWNTNHSDVLTVRSVGGRPCEWYEGDNVSIGLADRMAAELGGKYFSTNNVGFFTEGDLQPSSTDILSASSEYPKSTKLVAPINPDVVEERVPSSCHEGKKIAIDMPARETQPDREGKRPVDAVDHYTLTQIYVEDASQLTGRNRSTRRELFRGHLDTREPPDSSPRDWEEAWPYGDRPYPVPVQSEGMVPLTSIFQPLKSLLGPLTNLFRIGKRLTIGNVSNDEHLLNPEILIDPDDGTAIAPPVGIPILMDGQDGGHLNEIVTFREMCSKKDGTISECSGQDLLESGSDCKETFERMEIDLLHDHDLETGEKVWIDQIAAMEGQCTFEKGINLGLLVVPKVECRDHNGIIVGTVALTGKAIETQLECKNETDRCLEGVCRNANGDRIDVAVITAKCVDAAGNDMAIATEAVCVATGNIWDTLIRTESQCITETGNGSWDLESHSAATILECEAEAHRTWVTGSFQNQGFFNPKACYDQNGRIIRDKLSSKNVQISEKNFNLTTDNRYTSQECANTAHWPAGVTSTEWKDELEEIKCIGGQGCALDGLAVNNYTTIKLDRDSCECGNLGLCADTSDNNYLVKNEDGFDVITKTECTQLAVERGSCSLADITNKAECLAEDPPGVWSSRAYQWFEGPGVWENSGFFVKGCTAEDESAATDDPDDTTGNCANCYMSCIERNKYMDASDECNPRNCCGREDFCPSSQLNGSWVVNVIGKKTISVHHPKHVEPEHALKSPELKYDDTNSDNPLNTKDNKTTWDDFAKPASNYGTDVGLGVPVGPFGEFANKPGTCKRINKDGTVDIVTADHPTKSMCESAGYTWEHSLDYARGCVYQGGITVRCVNGVWTRHGGIFRIVVGAHDGTPWPGMDCKQAASEGPVDLDFWFQEIPEACCNIHTPLQDNVCQNRGFPGYGPSSSISTDIKGAALYVNIHEQPDEKE